MNIGPDGGSFVLGGESEVKAQRPCKLYEVDNPDSYRQVRFGTSKDAERHASKLAKRKGREVAIYRRILSHSKGRCPDQWAYHLTAYPDGRVAR